MPVSDDAFVQTLSRLAADVAPTIDVDTSHIASRGRRRRDRRRSFAAGTLGVVMIAGIGIAQAPAWTANPVVSAHETLPLDRTGRVGDAPEQSIAPAIATFDATTEATAADDDPAGLPTALVVGLGAAGVGALGAGAFFAVRSRRHAR